MNQAHKSDEYNLTQLSRSGQAGFETLKGGDGRFYFHFNDASGKALLFSQAYQKIAECEAGMKSVIKNATLSDRFLRVKSTDKKHYFVLRAGNRIEIARSRNFSSEAEMEKQLSFFSQNANSTVEKATQSPVEQTVKQAIAVVEKVPVAISVASTHSLEKLLEIENDVLKKRVRELETQLSQNAVFGTPIDAEGEDVTTTQMSRHVFRIEVFKSGNAQRLHGKITHPLSGETKVFSGIDSQTITDFIASTFPLENVLPVETVKKSLPFDKTDFGQPRVSVSTPLSNPKDSLRKGLLSEEIRNVAMSQYVRIENAPLKAEVPLLVPPVFFEKGEAKTDTFHPVHEAFEVTATNLIHPSESIKTSMPFQLALTLPPFNENDYPIGTLYTVRVYAFSFDKRERFLLIDKQDFIKPEDRSIKVIIYAGALPPDSYRLTMSVSFGTKTGEFKQRHTPILSGEMLLQVF